MGFKIIASAAAALLATNAAAAPSASKVTYSNTGSSLTFVFQNNLNASEDYAHVGAILLDPKTPSDGAAACAALGETLLSNVTIAAHSADFLHALSYLEYNNQVKKNQQFFIKEGAVTVTQGVGFTYVASTSKSKEPILCTQSSNSNSPYAAATATDKLNISSSGNTYIGYRNQKSFRFSGIPYANTPARFEYSTVYSATGQVLDATKQGADCAQAYDGTSQEVCNFLNIQTPFFPKAGSKSGLKPVLFSIHGGGFTGGNGGAGSGEDGGNLASREDIVSVEINYRLSTLGFLAIPGTSILGNFGIADQITALRWVKQNIASFGKNDPSEWSMPRIRGASMCQAVVLRT